MLSSSALAKYHSAREALFEVALETDHYTLTNAYVAFYWDIFMRSPKGVSTTIQNFQKLPREVFGRLRLETNVGTRTFFRGYFAGSDLLQRLGLPPLLTTIEERFKERGYTLRQNPTTNAIVIESNTSEILPDDIVCPITHTIMDRPVVASDGHTYEREAITQIVSSTRVSPMTRETLSTVLLPNHALRKRIASYALDGENKRVRGE